MEDTAQVIDFLRVNDRSGEEPDGQGVFFLLVRYGSVKKTTNNKSTDASTAYVPDGRPSIFRYFLSYSVLIRVRFSKCVGMGLALFMTSFVPVSGWHVPVIGSKLEQANEDSDRMWLAFCVSCVVLRYGLHRGRT